VEHITPSPFVLADGLISLTMAKGQRYEVWNYLHLYIFL
jgi:hypothetical protein